MTSSEVRAIADPRARMQAAKAGIQLHRRAIAELAQVTRDTVAELRTAGLSAVQIAEVLGISRSRVYQLASSDHD